MYNPNTTPQKVVYVEKPETPQPQFIQYRVPTPPQDDYILMDPRVTAKWPNMTTLEYERAVIEHNLKLKEIEEMQKL